MFELEQELLGEVLLNKNYRTKKEGFRVLSVELISQF
jgi:hypothetical protein